MAEPCSLCCACRFHVWQCGSELSLWPRVADAGPGRATRVLNYREGEVPIPRRVFQRAQQNESWNTESLRQHTPVRHYYGGVDSGEGGPVERSNFVLEGA